ncbi:BREX-2 system adenine-specific DNA-methyltransferase PglX [Shewanella frigidimarina]|uniref:BREX-2 system adenine-specific DNA-methyltransferase PglX n=1 Tax=Shewanella frigidimarina TaxID=56812 RepID=UPI003D7A8D0B
MIKRSDLLKDLQRELPKIEKDILVYSESKEELAEHLQNEYEKAQAAGRTAEHFVSWREAQITQSAVAWLLTCVFVRFLEDNNLLVEPMLSGPATRALNGKESKPLQNAKERMVAFFNENPTLEERDYLLDLFAELERFPVIAELLDHRHNPLWQIPVSSDGAKALIDFFQKIDANSGEVIHDFTDDDWDTRFLGDLYQDLSESVRKRYALLQTPEFVESFILDYTLEKAKDTFGLPGLRLIDPTCGSGHFLLTTFDRMFDAWQKREPATNARELAQRALDVVHGVDINPYAIAICRFRLLIAAMKAAGSYKVKDAPNFNFNLACGDSLLHGRRFEWQGQGLQSDLIDEDPVKHVLEVEDKDKLLKILGQQYHAVVGNPPYITVADKALNQAYRDRYITCHRKYSLSVPFMERFFDLCITGRNGRESGYVGKITANSFGKREFGTRLVKDFLAHKDLTTIIDTSGAYIPGHATPTVILFGRNRSPVSSSIFSLLGGAGEPGIPENPKFGKVWQSIVDFTAKGENENDYITAINRERYIYNIHPWSLNGGGDSELKEILDSTSKSLLQDRISIIGFGAILGEDEAFSVPLTKEKCSRLPRMSRTAVEGEVVRDWMIKPANKVVFPYNEDIHLVADQEAIKWMWPLKPLLSLRSTFGGRTYKSSGKAFYEYHQIPIDRNKESISLCFASVATQNHFALNRYGKVLKQSAPLLVLKGFNDENEYLSLLAILNSSLASFWMKQVFMDKGNGGIGGGIGDEKWERRFDHDGTKLKKFPLTTDVSSPLSNFTKLVELSTNLQDVASKLSNFTSLGYIDTDIPTQNWMLKRKFEIEILRKKAIFLQEEIDWHVYYIYGLIDEDLTLDSSVEFEGIALGERIFEVILSIKVERGETVTAWFDRHASKRIMSIDDFPKSYRDLLNKRWKSIEKNKSISTVETITNKRRWNSESIAELESNFFNEWVLNKIEKMLCEISPPLLITVSQLIDLMQKDREICDVLNSNEGKLFSDIRSYMSTLIESDSCPVGSAYRLKESGWRKFKVWQETWHKQRQEDAIDVEFGVDQPLSEEDASNEEKLVAYNMGKAKAAAKKVEVVGEVPLPPKYAAGDFRKLSYWSLRGKLDVPKERFISLPGCEKDGDSTLVIGWAGMNHLQRATAIATWYLDRKETDGWEVEKLKPMLVAIDELIPWLKQWHNDIDPEFGERMGDYYEGFLLEEMRMLDVTKDDLLAWEPVLSPKEKAASKKRAAVKKPATNKTENNLSAEINDTDTNKEQG